MEFIIFSFLEWWLWEGVCHLTKHTPSWVIWPVNTYDGILFLFMLRVLFIYFFSLPLAATLLFTICML